jgi:YjbE family integral membrane protein
MLIYIAWRLTQNNGSHGDVKAATTFWGAMGTIVMADAVMGVDNALAIAGAAAGNWTLIILGLLISVPIILFGSTLVTKILDRFPNTIYLGAFVLYLVAGKMITNEPFMVEYLSPLDDWIEKILPFLAAIILTTKQYYRTEIRKKN